MPKSIVVDPQKVRKSGAVEVPRIPVNQYRSDIQAELARFGAEGLKRIWLDMITIREFESMLNAIKIQGSWKGIEYNHKGPAHLSIGQEAASVGQCASLRARRLHLRLAPQPRRDPGQVPLGLAPAARARARRRSWSGFLGGETLRVAEKIPHGGAPDLAEDFILFGTLAEIFARKVGFNRGLGGSMHAFFTPFGSMPNNAIVGGSADIATGAALFKRINRKPGIVVCQHRRRVDGLRPGVGGHVPGRHGPVPDALGQGCRRRPAHPLQLLQQLLRHGRPDRRRDHGLRRPGPRRRGREPGGHARRARRRLQPARRRRRGGPQEEDPARGQGPRPPRHDHLPHLGPLALRRLQLPQRRRRSSSGRPPMRSAASPTTWSRTRSRPAPSWRPPTPPCSSGSRRRSSWPPATPSAPASTARSSSR